MNKRKKLNDTTQRILVIENEPDFVRLITLNLNALNYEVVQTTNLQQAAKLISCKSFDLILMDRMLPDGDSIILCQQLRQAGKEIPIMLLTTKNTEADIVLGLESGADDYLVRPFSMLELMARVKSLLRRGLKHQLQNKEQQLKFHGVSINRITREVLVFNQQLSLTAREFGLLVFLAQHPYQVFSRLQLLEAVWGYSYSGYEHTVSSHINRLRSKIASCSGDQELIKTVWGGGYKFSPPNSQLTF